MEEKHVTDIEHNNSTDHGSSSVGSQEKGQPPRDNGAYPSRDEDYVVTFKTWIVVTVLASAYGVDLTLPQHTSAF